MADLVLTGVEAYASHVFQVWFIREVSVPVGTLRPSRDGLGFLILQHEGDPVSDSNLFGVTVEPPGGSPAPMTDPDIGAEIVELIPTSVHFCFNQCQPSSGSFVEARRL